MRTLSSFVLATTVAALCGGCGATPPRAMLSSQADVSAPAMAAGGDAVAATHADLAISAVADRKSVKIGENITFTITVTNHGPDAATEVVFGDPLPDPLNFVSFTCTEGTVTGSYCTVPSIPSGGSVTATMVATPILNPARSERRFTNTGFIQSSGVSDPNPANNSASLDLRIVGK